MPHALSALAFTFDHAVPLIGSAMTSCWLIQRPVPPVGGGSAVVVVVVDDVVVVPVTVIIAEPVTPPPVAATATCPDATPLTRPVVLTVATAGFALAQLSATPVIGLPA